MELESKAFGSEAPNLHNLEVKKAFEDFLAGFEAFKQSNDERLKGLEKRSGDVIAEDKVDRINKALETQQRHLDALLLDAARPALGGERKAFDPRSNERSQAFDRYVRRGDAGGLEIKALSEGSNADGGYTVPLEIERTIDRVLSQASPIRAIATVRHAWNAGGDLTISWLRRDRDPASAHLTQVTMPMSEAREAYDLEILDAGGAVVRTFSAVAQHSQLYTLAQQAADFPSGLPNPLMVQVYQLSSATGRGRQKKEALYVR